ncbi:MAG: site-specific DNA-methyltransferase [Sediminibacterium sp.]|nr:site-specific DNA-methyltransferase [Sediminibacterium sp.]
MPTLQFKGKNILWNHHLSVPYHTLEEVEDLHFQPEKGNGNLIIEGDNLIALKALLPEYAGKVKCIYIDPPYNTGNEGWVYNDKVNSPLINNWLGKTVGTDDLTRHDKWLCMMTPRLKMLRDLLSDDGAIFISIDDNEVANLKLLMDEIFGEENFVNFFIWINNSAGRQIQSSGAATTKEHILVYAKNITLINDFLIDTEYAKKTMPFMYKGFDFDIKLDEYGEYITTHELNNGNSIFNENTRPNLVFDILYNPENNQVRVGDLNCELPNNFVRIEPKKINNGVNKLYAWRWGKEKILIEKHNLEFINSNNGWSVFTKRRDFKYTTFKDIISNISTNNGSSDLKKLEVEQKFDFPKPVNLIKQFIICSTDKSSIILDSFAGSGTTMHAVNELNKEDGGNRKCILIQMKEDSEAEPNKNICQQITRERNKLAIEKYGYESGFTYLKVGIAIDPEKMLEGQLPTYHQFAKYIYYLGTGKHLEEAQNINTSTHFVGTHGAKAFYLIYEQDVEALTKMALNLSIAEDIVKHSPNKRRVIYAPACFLDSDYMEEKQIEFVSIPYNLFERKEN